MLGPCGSSPQLHRDLTDEGQQSNSTGHQAVCTQNGGFLDAAGLRANGLLEAP